MMTGRNTFIGAALFLVTFVFAFGCSLERGDEDVLNWIDPLIGTEGQGSQYGGMMPYTGVPFGSVQWVPMTRTNEVGVLSFNSSDDKIIGFTATRQPSIWMGDWGQLSFMPRVGDVDCDFETRGYVLEQNTASYSPYLTSLSFGGIQAEMAGDSHAGIFSFKFPADGDAHIVIDASREYSVQKVGCSSRIPASGSLQFSEDGLSLWGYNSDMMDIHHSYPLPDFKGWFVMRFSRPFVDHGIASEGDDARGWISFGKCGEPLMVKVGVSLISKEQAEANLDKEIPDWNLAAVSERSKEQWQDQISRIVIDTPNDSIKTIFYTGLYHASLYPRDISEYGRYYSAFDDQVHEGTMYNCWSMWDTYRAEHPLLNFIAPERVDDMMQSLLEMYKEGGWLPKWPNPCYTGIMVGSPAETILAEAYVKGFRGFDLDLAYEAVKKNATVPQPTDSIFRWEDRGLFGNTPETRAGLGSYMSRGYVDCEHTTESVSRTQDFGLNDRGAAVLAEAAGHPEDARYFYDRSYNYRNLWNPSTRRFNPRNVSGEFVAEAEANHPYCESSEYTALWCVPYDVEGLIELMGGEAAFTAELDNYFSTVFFVPERGNRSIHGNELCHHTAYLYNYAGQAEKAQRQVREILSRCYSIDRKGFDGNEDCGQMSAWYVLSALGFYPVDTASGNYEIGSPIVDGAVLRLKGGPYGSKTLKIVCHNQRPEHCLVRMVKVNGKRIEGHQFSHAQLAKGGKIDFYME